MKKRTVSVLWGILLISWMGVIFYFSAQDKTVSSGESGRIVAFLIRLFVPGYDAFSADRQENLTKILTLLIRKGAHFTEYLILGILIFENTKQGFRDLLSRIMKRKRISSEDRSEALRNRMKEKRCRSGRQFLFSWAAGTLYAVTDEVHQLFSYGRAARIMDVGIDSSGVCCGVLLMIFFCFLAEKHSEKKRKYQK